jgi:hypothetical protein
MNQISLCEVEDCEDGVRARGFCPKHYQAAKREGLLVRKGCLVPECEGDHYGRGVCKPHYKAKARQDVIDANLICESDGCDQFGFYKGLCWSHHQSMKANAPVGRTNLDEWDWIVGKLGLVGASDRRVKF